ncbi:Inner membrane protein YjcH [compost metagenome]
MSSNLVYQKIRENPQYRTLVRSRSRLAFTLSAVVLGFYSLFIASVLWQPQLLTHVPPGSGSLTIGIWAALILVVGSWLLTGLYVLYANNQFDKLTEALLKGVRP